MSFRWREHVDKVMAAAATITAVVAVVIALVEVRTQREFQMLSVEPYLELYNTGTEEEDRYAFVLENSGLGPAVIEHAVARLDGADFTEWREVAAALTGAEPGSIRTTTSDLWPGRRVQSGAAVSLVQLSPYDATARAFHRAMSAGDRRVELSICYCSVYGDCWTIEYGSQLHVPSPTCPRAE